MPRTKSNQGKRRPRAGPSRNRKDFKGSALRPAPDPLPVVFCPWYNLVLVTTGTSNSTAGAESTITSSSLFTQFRSQLGIVPSMSDSGFAMRIQRCYIWATPKDAFKSIDLGVAFYGIVGSSTSTSDQLTPARCYLEDFGSGSRSASVGYEWPLIDQQTPFYSYHDNKINLATIACNLPSMPLQYHWHVLWQSASPAAVPRASMLLQRLALSTIGDGRTSRSSGSEPWLDLSPGSLESREKE